MAEVLCQPQWCAYLHPRENKSNSRKKSNPIKDRVNGSTVKMFPRNHPQGGSCQERLCSGKKPETVWRRQKDWEKGKENHSTVGKGEDQICSGSEKHHQHGRRASKKTRAHHQMWRMSESARFKTTSVWPLQTRPLLHNWVPETPVAPSQGELRILGHAKTSQKRSQVKTLKTRKSRTQIHDISNEWNWTPTGNGKKNLRN